MLLSVFVFVEQSDHSRVVGASLESVRHCALTIESEQSCVPLIDNPRDIDIPADHIRMLVDEVAAKNGA